MLLQHLLEMKEGGKVTYRISFSAVASSPNEADLFKIPANASDEIQFTGKQCAEYEKEMLDLLKNHRSGQAKKPFDVISLTVNSVTFNIDRFVDNAKNTALDYGQKAYDRVNTYRSAVKYTPDMPYSVDFTISLSRKFSNQELEDLAGDAGGLIWGQYYGEVPFSELDVTVL